jgi:hypothetical protein
MKNQFVGDINDYYKYGLLRILSGAGTKKIGVCWMLTPDRTQYLEDPGTWREFDPILFDKLGPIVQARTIKRIREAGILRRACFCEEPFKGGLNQRETYFDETLGKFADRDLIFFDPDTGLAPPPSKSKAKWLHYHELGKSFQRGHSVFLIQFPRREKADWVAHQAKKIRKATGAAMIYTFRASRASTVVFFLAAYQRDVNFFCRQPKAVKQRWGRVITVTSVPGHE